MYEKKHYYSQVTFVFVFRPKLNVRLRFVFGRKWNFIFVGIFVYGRKWKMLFGLPLVYITKMVLVLVLRCKVSVLVLKLRSWSWSCSWRKVLITSLMQCCAIVGKILVNKPTFVSLTQLFVGLTVRCYHTYGEIRLYKSLRIQNTLIYSVSG